MNTDGSNATLTSLRAELDDVRASRARLAATAVAERRQAELELNDGAWQELILANLKLNLLLERPISDQDAVEALDEVSGQLRRTLDEIRDFAHRLYPAVLRRAGLTEALRLAVARRPLPAGFQFQGLSRYPEAIEAAVYFCCLEALEVAADRTPDLPMRVSLRGEESLLTFQITLEAPDSRAVSLGGEDLVHVRDRLGAVGGELRLEVSPVAGTRLVGTVPLPSNDRPE